MTRVAVIGAGPAGLVSAREALRQGCDVTVFESGASVCGVWVHSAAVEDNPLGEASVQTVHRSLYDSLTTNIPRDLMPTPTLLLILPVVVRTTGHVSLTTRVSGVILTDLPIASISGVISTSTKQYGVSRNRQPAGRSQPIMASANMMRSWSVMVTTPNREYRCCRASSSLMVS